MPTDKKPMDESTVDQSNVKQRFMRALWANTGAVDQGTLLSDGVAVGEDFAAF